MGTVRTAALAFISASLLLGVSTLAEDPLPVVQPKAAAPVTDPPQASSGSDIFAMPTVILAVYPIRDLAAVATVETADPVALRTILRDALAANDQERFSAALTRARTVAESNGALRHDVTVYSDLEQVWSYATTDRYGAFYDEASMPGLHARLAGAYPSYAAYIAQYALTDANGRVLYPTSETRQFLQRQLNGVRAIPPVTATTRATSPATTRATQPATTPATTPAPARTRSIEPVPVAKTHPRIEKASVSPKPAVTPKPAAVKPEPAPVKVAAVVPPPQTQPVTAAPQTSEPVTQQPVTQQASAQPAAAHDALASDMHRATNAPVAPAPVRAEGNVVSSSRTTQGLLFIIIALVTIGVMTIWARTPQTAEQPTQIFKPVEPLASGESPSPKKDAEIVPIKQNRAS